MIKRVFVAFSRLLFLSGFAGIILSSFIDLDRVFVRIFFVLFLLGSFTNVLCARCPHCRKLGLNSNPFAQNAGHCKHCGHLVEYR